MAGIHSPEALWARQLASQRTAFAIAGEGPIQSDLFPILEYAAPRAFYIGLNATLFKNYDERTRQAWIAPAGKIATLRALPRHDMLSVFVPFASVNRELMESLVQRGEGADAPCVFKTNLPPASAVTNESDLTLARAVARLNAGDFKQATQLAALARQQNQTNDTAAYLMRVIDREAQGGRP